jgi:hypothetical protein
MKTKIRNVLVVIFLISAFYTKTNAQENNEKLGKTEISLEIDPATFAFNGYSAHLRLKPKGSDHLLIGAGIYAMDMPSPFVDINKENKDKGWNVRINNALGFFGEHHFKETNSGFFVGGQLGIQQFKIENDEIAGSQKFTNSLMMGYGGYTISPFDFNLYFKIWAGLGYTSKIDGENILGNSTYDISPITSFATLHIGYTF